MKREILKKLLAVAGCVTLVCAVDVSVSAAVQGTASATGDIVAAIQIEKLNDLSFGKIAAGSVQSTIVLDPTAGTTAKGTGDAQVMTGTVTPAEFSITGATGNAYSVQLPADFQVASGGNKMDVKSFTSDPAVVTGLQGTVDLKIGATLTVGANQAAGTYTAPNALVINVTYD